MIALFSQWNNKSALHSSADTILCSISCLLRINWFTKHQSLSWIGWYWSVQTFGPRVNWMDMTTQHNTTTKWTEAPTMLKYSRGEESPDLVLQPAESLSHIYTQQKCTLSMIYELSLAPPRPVKSSWHTISSVESLQNLHELFLSRRHTFSCSQKDASRTGFFLLVIVRKGEIR